MNATKYLKFLIPGATVLITVLLVSSFIGAAAPAQTSKSDSTVGYVDMEKLQTDLPDYQQLKAEIEGRKAQLKSYQGQLYTTHKNAAKVLQDKATQDKTGKSAAEQAEIDKQLQADIQKKAEELNGQLEQKGAEIQKALAEQNKVVVEKVKKLIADVAKDQKLSMVLDKNAIFFGGTDITQLVIDKAKKEADSNAKTK
jgi:outer membrane protein